MTKRLLFIGDGVVPTGFGRVLHNIIGNLPMEKYEVHHIAINYDGDPHPYNWKIYPALRGGGSFSTTRDLYGISRLKDFVKIPWDGIFLLNDTIVINKYLEAIKENIPQEIKIPPIIVYFPVDSMDLDIQWFKNFDIVSKTVVYTQFGKDEVEKKVEGLDIEIIPHGYDPEVFHKLEGTKEEIKLKYLGEPFVDSFIILNANRNQPRKRVDLTVEGFQIFAKDKPDNVKLYLHMGSKDSGYDVLSMVIRDYELGEVTYPRIDNRLLMTTSKGGIPRGIQAVSNEELNIIYNVADLGINTAVGEGWGLCNFEQASLGIPQLVPNNSANIELYGDTGLLIPIDRWERNRDTLTVGGLVHPMDVADSLELIYNDKKLYKDISRKTLKKFGNSKYHWKTIVNEQWLPLIGEVFG